MEISDLVLVEAATWPVTLSSSLSELRAARHLCDVTLLAGDGATLGAHACVLAAASPYLRSLLTADGAPAGCTLQLDGVCGSVLAAVVEFAYAGRVTVALDALRGLTAAADQLGLAQLRELCDALLRQMPATADEAPFADVAVKREEMVGDDAATTTTTTAGEGEDSPATKEETPLPALAQVDVLDVPEGTGVTGPGDTEAAAAAAAAAAAPTDGVITPAAGASPMETTPSAVETATSAVELTPAELCVLTVPDLDVPDDVDVVADVVGSEQVVYLQENDEGEPTVLHTQLKSEAVISVLNDAHLIATGNTEEVDDQPHPSVSQQLEGGDARSGQEEEEEEEEVERKEVGGVATAARPFACDRCPKTFTRRGHLDEHARVHSGQVYRCELCPKTFQWKRGLELHARLHSGEKPYACEICLRRFSHPSNLIVHRRRHGGHKSFACRACPQTFCSQSSLIRHRKRHTDQPSLSCTYCERVFFERSVLKRHMRRHTGERPYACAECGARFADVTGLTYHKWTHRPDRPLRCHTCGFGCISASQLAAHTLTHTDERPFPCTVCEKAFKIRANLTVHMRTHTGERPYACCLCERRFVTSSQLSKHTLVHERRDRAEERALVCPPELAPYQCSVCGKRFGRRNNMLQHERLHTGAHAFRCSGCGAGFPRRTHLEKHHAKLGHGHPDDLLAARERTALREAAAFAHTARPCPRCGKRFADDNTLLQHDIVCRKLKTEEDDDDDDDGGVDDDGQADDDPDARKFACDVCARTFKRNSHLKQHVRTHDRMAFFFSAEGRPFECDVCKKRFKRKNTLKQHQLTHADSGSRKCLLCYLCGRGFIRSTHLATHLRAMHAQSAAADMLLASTKVKASA